jgi:hypothetical protein
MVRTAVIFLLVATALAPSLAAACAVSCAANDCEHTLGAAQPEQPPCHGEHGSPDSPGQPVDGSAAMASMCAFAAAATISNGEIAIAPMLDTLDIQAPTNVPISFFTLPADEPPKA